MTVTPASDPLDVLLRAFVGPWVRAAASARPPPHAIYVDAFAGAEWACGARRGGLCRAAGSAEAAARAGAGVALVEEDPVLLRRLEVDLERRGCGARLRTGAAAVPAPGEILLVEADSRGVADVVSAAGPEAAIRVWAAPPAAAQLPWRTIEPILARPAAELLLRFPDADFRRQADHAEPLADLPPVARWRVEGCSALLGDARHGWLRRWRIRQHQNGTEAALAGLLDDFAVRLTRERRRVRAVDLAGARLLLAAASPESALAFNEAVERAGGQSAPFPGEEHAGGLPDLFGAVRPPPAVGTPVGVLAEHLYARLRGGVLPLREVLAAAAETSATASGVRRALLRLRCSGRAVYGSLRSPDAVVTFPQRPVRPSPAPRRRAPVPGETGDLFAPAAGQAAPGGSGAGAPPPSPPISRARSRPRSRRRTP